MLRQGTEAQRVRETKKLHLRWWHASATKMEELLRRVGVDEARLKFIKPIVDTCRECRAWLTPKPRTIPSMRVSIRFNQHVEIDLMFYKKEVILHLNDRGTRWHAGMVLRSDAEGKKK